MRIDFSIASETIFRVYGNDGAIEHIDGFADRPFVAAGRSTWKAEMREISLISYPVCFLHESESPCGLTFDTKRRRLILISLGGEGHMYAFNVDEMEWLLLTDMGNRDAKPTTIRAQTELMDTNLSPQDVRTVAQ